MDLNHISVRRTVAIAATVGLAATLAACGGSDDGAGDGPSADVGTVELTFANFYTGPDIDTVNAMVEAFNASHEGIVVTNQAILSETLETELPSLVAAGSAYDIVATNDWTHTRLVASGVIEPLDEETLSGVGISADDYYSNIWDLAKWNDALYGVPFGATSAIFFSNATLMAEKGISAVPTTYNELVDAGIACTADTSGRGPRDSGFDGSAVDTYGLGVSADFAAPIGVSILAQNGGTLWDDNGDVAFDSDAGRAALKTLNALQTTDQISPRAVTHEADLASFKAGKSCFMISGAWELKGLVEAGLDVGVNKLPVLGTQAASWGGAAWLGFPVQKDSYDEAKRAAALEFIAWATSAEGSLMWTESGNLPARPDVAESAEYAKNPAAVVAQALDELYIPAEVPWVPQVSVAWADAYSAVLSEGVEPEAALASAASTGQANVDEARQNYPDAG